MYHSKTFSRGIPPFEGGILATYFQLLRLIVIAEYQNVVYNEYLRALFTPEAYRTYDLDTQPSVYDPNMDPTIAAEMSTAAFR